MDFEAWNEALCRHYFSRSSEPAPVFFFTDDDALSEIHPSGDPDQACASLVRAVDARLDHGTNNLFRSVRQEHQEWKDGDRRACPPSLPLLALTVNAATHMQGDGDVRRTNYYVRLRELLALAGHGIPDGFDRAMHELWEDLSTWLDSDQKMARGRSTIRTHPQFHNIGYPISQALFRQSDANRLNRFFDRLGLPPFSTWDEGDPPISKTELRIHYRIWAPTAAGLSPGARQLANNENYQDLLEEILWAAVTQWERAEAEPGVAITYLALGFSPFPIPTLRLWIQRRDGMPESLTIDGRTYASNCESWYESNPIELRQAHIETGIDVRAFGEDTVYAIEYDPAMAIPFREDPVLGEWVEVRRVEPNEPHWVLCSGEVVDHVEEYLWAHADSQWKQWAEAPGLDGWYLYRNVEIVRTAPILDYPELWRLRPTTSLGLALKGGMKLAHLGNNVYLTDGAPDLWIPPGTAPAEGPTVVVDGKSHEGPGVEGGEFRLQDLDLAPGHHEIRVGQRTIRCHLIETAEETANGDAGSLGLRLTTTPAPRLLDWRVGVLATPENDEVTVSGGVIDGSSAYTPHRPVSLLTSARESFVLGACPDELSRPQEPDEPPWLERTDLMPSRYDYRPSFRVVWTVQRFSERHWHVECIRPDLMPDVTNIDDRRTARDWAGLLIATETEIVSANSRLGSEYVDAAHHVYEQL